MFKYRLVSEECQPITVFLSLKEKVEFTNGVFVAIHGSLGLQFTLLFFSWKQILNFFLSC